MKSPFISKGAALDKLLDASSIAGLIEQALNAVDGDDVPFAATYLEATMRQMRETLADLHYYFDECVEVTV